MLRAWRKWFGGEAARRPSRKSNGRRTRLGLESLERRELLSGTPFSLTPQGDLVYDGGSGRTVLAPDIRAFVTDGSGGAVALTNTGTLWDYTPSAKSKATQIDQGVSSLVGFAGGDVVALHTDGTLWEYTPEGRGKPFHTAQIDQGVSALLPLGKDKMADLHLDGSLWLLSQKDAASPPKVNQVASNVASAKVADDGSLYYLTTGGDLYKEGSKDGPLASGVAAFTVGPSHVYYLTTGGDLDKVGDKGGPLATGVSAIDETTDGHVYYLTPDATTNSGALYSLDSGLVGEGVTSFAAVGKKLYYLTTAGDLYQAGKDTPSPLASGVTSFGATSDGQVYYLTADPTTNSSALYSLNGGLVSDGVSAFASAGANAYYLTTGGDLLQVDGDGSPVAGGVTSFGATSVGQVYYLTDDPTTSTSALYELNGGLVSDGVTSLSVAGDNVYYATVYGELYQAEAVPPPPAPGTLTPDLVFDPVAGTAVQSAVVATGVQSAVAAGDSAYYLTMQGEVYQVGGNGSPLAGGVTTLVEAGDSAYYLTSSGVVCQVGVAAIPHTVTGGGITPDIVVNETPSVASGVTTLAAAGDDAYYLTSAGEVYQVGGNGSPIVGGVTTLVGAGDSAYYLTTGGGVYQVGQQSTLVAPSGGGITPDIVVNETPSVASGVTTLAAAGDDAFYLTSAGELYQVGVGSAVAGGVTTLVSANGSAYYLTSSGYVYQTSQQAVSTAPSGGGITPDIVVNETPSVASGVTTLFALGDDAYYLTSSGDLDQVGAVGSPLASGVTSLAVAGGSAYYLTSAGSLYQVGGDGSVLAQGVTTLVAAGGGAYYLTSAENLYQAGGNGSPLAGGVTSLAGAGGSAYYLTTAGDLYTVAPAAGQNLVSPGVASFAVAGNGQVYFLTDGANPTGAGNLYIAGLATGENQVATRVTSFAVGNDGAVYYLQGTTLYNATTGGAVRQNVFALGRGVNGQLRLDFGPGGSGDYDAAHARYVMHPAGTSDPVLTGAYIQFFTGADDKDSDTDVTVDVVDYNNVESAHIESTFDDFEEYTPSDTYALQIVNPTDKYATEFGRLRIHIQPVGHDTWDFGFRLVLQFSDGTMATYTPVDEQSLSQDNTDAVLTLTLPPAPGAAGAPPVAGSPGGAANPPPGGSSSQGTVLPFVVSDFGLSDDNGQTASLGGSGYVIFTSDGQGGWYFGGTIQLNQTGTVQPDGSLFPTDYSGVYYFQGHVDGDGLTEFYLNSSGHTLLASGSLDLSSGRFSGSVEVADGGTTITGAGFFDQG